MFSLVHVIDIVSHDLHVGQLIRGFHVILYRPSLRILFLDFVFDSGEFFWILEIFFSVSADLPEYSWFCFRIHNGMIGRCFKSLDRHMNKQSKIWQNILVGLQKKPVRNPTSKFCLLIFMDIHKWALLISCRSTSDFVSDEAH
jgi:hypothetical protein